MFVRWNVMLHYLYVLWKYKIKQNCIFKASYTYPFLFLFLSHFYARVKSPHRFTPKSKMAAGQENELESFILFLSISRYLNTLWQELLWGFVAVLFCFLFFVFFYRWATKNAYDSTSYRLQCRVLVCLTANTFFKNKTFIWCLI